MNRTSYWYPKIYQLEHILIGVFPGCSLVCSFPDGTSGKASAYQCQSTSGDTRDVGSTPESGRPPGVGNVILLQDACLENSVDKGPWRNTVCGAAKSQTQLSLVYVVCVCAQSLSCDPVDSSPPGSSVGFFRQESGAGCIFYSRGSFRPWDRIRLSCGFCVGRRIL